VGRALLPARNPEPGMSGARPDSWSRIEPGAVTGAAYFSLLQSPARQEL